MAQAWPELAPLSDAVTENVKVEVLSQYSKENSKPTQGQWVFEYTVRITNLGTETIQLVSRHWIITDGTDQVREVQGPGVVGEQPTLKPGEAFRYASGCPLPTPSGSMVGEFEMLTDEGERFEIEVPAFSLDLPDARRTVN